MRVIHVAEEKGFLFWIVAIIFKEIEFGLIGSAYFDGILPRASVHLYDLATGPRTQPPNKFVVKNVIRRRRLGIGSWSWGNDGKQVPTGT
jgi:hypothetical protein